jgi:hypothetical protein
MAVPTVRSPGNQGQGRFTSVQPQRTPTPKDATGSVLHTLEKELAFTQKIPNSEANLGKVHKSFIDAVFRATGGEVTLLSSNNRTTLSLTPSKSPRISRKMTQIIGPFSVAIPTNYHKSL